MNIKNKLKDSQEVFGIWSAIPSPEVVNVFAKTSLDYVIIDFEHSPVDYITAQRMVMAAKAEGKDALVRVGRLEEVEILRALDIGCDGIIVPHIESREDLCKVYSYAMYDESWGGEGDILHILEREGILFVKTILAMKTADCFMV